MDVLKFEVEEFLKFFFHLFDFWVFLLDVLFAFGLEDFHVLSEPVDLVILLLSDFLDSVFDHSLNVVFFVYNFP